MHCQVRHIVLLIQYCCRDSELAIGTTGEGRFRLHLFGADSAMEAGIVRRQ